MKIDNGNKAKDMNKSVHLEGGGDKWNVIVFLQLDKYYLKLMMR